MNPTSETASYRIRSFLRKGDTPKKYRRTYEVIDEATQARMAVCDLVGQAVFSTLVIADHERRIWTLKPNRKIMPSRWSLSGPDGDTPFWFDQKIMGKFLNPVGKTMLSIQDAAGTEVFRLSDARNSLANRMLDLTKEDWVILRGETPVAKLGYLDRPTQPAKGVFGWLRNKMKPADQAVISAGPAHVLPAPAALAMLLLFYELNDTSGG